MTRDHSFLNRFCFIMPTHMHIDITDAELNNELRLPTLPSTRLQTENEMGRVLLAKETLTLISTSNNE